MKSKLLKVASKIVFVFIILVAFIFLVECGKIYKDLQKYDFTIQNIPKTMAVSLNLNDGFIIGKNEYNRTIFIGNKNADVYTDMFAEMGYYEIDQMGLVGFYSMNDDKKI